MEKIYYIDSENVGDSWIELLDELTQLDSRLIVFYTKHSPRMTYQQTIQLMNSANKPEFIECHEGSNALDFQLVSYLGYELCADRTKEMIIVSKDTGFDAVVHFWQERGMQDQKSPYPKSAARAAHNAQNSFPCSSDSDRRKHRGSLQDRQGPHSHTPERKLPSKRTPLTQTAPRSPVLTRCASNKQSLPGVPLRPRSQQ